MMKIKKNKNIEYLKIEMNPEKFVKEKLSGYEISTSDINHLIDLCKEDITKLETNLNHSRRDLSDLEEKDSLQTLSERHLNNEYEECSRNNLILKIRRFK